MSEPSELPALALAPFFALLGLPLLLRGLVLFARQVPAAPTPPRAWRWADLVLVVAAVVLVAQLGAALGPAASAGSTSVGALLWMQASLLSGAALAYLCARRRGEGLASLGLVRPNEARAYLGALALYVPLFLTFCALTIPWAHLARHLGWPEHQEILAALLALEGPDLWLCLVIAVVIGPFLEELLFRGFLQAACEQWLGPRAGLGLTALLFASLHGRVGWPGLFLLSLFLGWLRQRTGSTFVACVAHMLHNGVTLALALGAGIR